MKRKIIKRIIRDWNRFPREAVESLSLGSFTAQLAEAPQPVLLLL